MKKLIPFYLVFVLSVTNINSNAQTEVTFYTSMGDFVTEMYDTLQPITAGNFVSLVNAKFYDGVIFHRVISNFMIQGGDPTGTGSGGPGYSIPDEFDPLTSNVQKSLAMANSGPNTGGSQFFINLKDNLNLDSGYPVFGIVISNFSVVQAIGIVQTNSSDRPLVDVVMDSVRVTSIGPLGLNEQKPKSMGIRVYPNPTKGNFTIDLGNDFLNKTGHTLNIINMLGEVVQTSLVNMQQLNVDLSAQDNKGVYFVCLADSQSDIVDIKKIVLL